MIFIISLFLQNKCFLYENKTYLKYHICQESSKGSTHYFTTGFELLEESQIIKFQKNGLFKSYEQKWSKTFYFVKPIFVELPHI